MHGAGVYIQGLLGRGWDSRYPATSVPL